MVDECLPTVRFRHRWDLRPDEGFLTTETSRWDRFEPYASAVVVVDAARDTAALFDNFVDVVKRHTRQPSQPW